MIIKWYYKKLGGHFHVRCFTGKAKNMTFASNGKLVFDEAEWNDIRNMLNSAVDFIEDE